MLQINLDSDRIYKNSFSTFCRVIMRQKVAKFYDPIIKAAEERKKNLCILLPRGHGKAQDLNSTILTTEGFKKIKDLKVSDIIFNTKGKPQRINRLLPIEETDLYEVTTRDGRKIVCSGEHDWLVDKYHEGYRIVETKEMCKKLYIDRLDKRSNKRYKEYVYYIDTISPVEFEEKELPIDPYTLGAWLGDGSSANGQITTADNEIFDYIPFTPKNIPSSKYNFNLIDLHKKLRLLGVKKNKHIPWIYLHGSVHQREELLRGLIDTDGYVQLDGHVLEIITKFDRLNDDIIYLIRSLGGTCTHSIKHIIFNGKPKQYHRITFRLKKGTVPCKLSRKLKNWKGSIKTKTAIIDVKPVGKGLARCINVESQYGDYIAQDFLPTQNSLTFSRSFPLYIINKSEKPVTIIIESMNQDMSRRILGMIRDALTSNPYFSKYKFKKETDKLLEIYVPGHEGDNEYTHKLYSVPLGTRGLHGDYVISDDIMKDDAGNSSTNMMRLKQTWWNATYPMSQSKHGFHIVVGTPQGNNDIFADIKEIVYKRDGNWAVYEFPAIQYDEDGNPKALFPELLNLEKLYEIKNSAPSWTWEQEYMLRPVGKDSMFPTSLIEKCVDLPYEEPKDDEIKNMMFYMGCDVAMSSSSTADFSAFVVVSKFPNRPIRIEHIWHEKGVEEDEQIKEIKNLKRIYNINKGIIERKGLTYSMAGKVVTDTELAGIMDEWNPTNEEKQKVLGNLQLLMKHKMLDIPSGLEHFDELVSELSSFGIINENGKQTYRAFSGHDDLVIGVALAVSAAGGWVFDDEVPTTIELI